MRDEGKERIATFLQRDEHIEVAWLYGSRVTNTDSPDSDWDIAVAFAATDDSAGRPSLVLDDIEYRLRSELGLPITVIDINRVPTPLAWNVVTKGEVVVCTSDLRLRSEEQRIWSLWEEYKFEHERNRQAL